jgi:hypothetical protein
MWAFLLMRLPVQLPHGAITSDVHASLFHVIYLSGGMDSYIEQVEGCKTACTGVAVRREEVIIV